MHLGVHLMARYEQNAPWVDAALWNGTDSAPIDEIVPGCEVDGETLMVPGMMGGMMMVPKDSYVTKDQYGNTNWQPKDTFEANYELVA